VITAIVVALTTAVVFAACGPLLARSLAPAVAVRLLVATCVVAASASVFVLAVVAFVGAAQLGEVAEAGHWSAAAMHALSPISALAASIAGLLLAPAGGWAVVYLVGTARAIRVTQQACHGMSTADRVLVVDSDRVEAFTTPGLSGRVVVTTALLQALDERQQRALLAHEHSHLRHRHPWWTITADLTAAVNPMLRPTARAIRHACERWADEDAANVTSRRVVATTIIHAALLANHPPATASLAATGGQIPARVRALLDPPPRTRTLPAAVTAALATLMIVSTVVVQRSAETLFETADRAAAVTTVSGGHHA
jgi:beta-lactamase regulating signal transducer with metallopeptidase domain